MTAKHAVIAVLHRAIFRAASAACLRGDITLDGLMHLMLRPSVPALDLSRRCSACDEPAFEPVTSHPLP